MVVDDGVSPSRGLCAKMIIFWHWQSPRGKSFEFALIGYCFNEASWNIHKSMAGNEYQLFISSRKASTIYVKVSFLKRSSQIIQMKNKVTHNVIASAAYCDVVFRSSLQTWLVCFNMVLPLIAFFLWNASGKLVTPKKLEHVRAYGQFIPIYYLL